MPITVKDLLEAGCHFGHQTKRWNPKMKEYVYGNKSGISIIDLTKTIHQLSDACNFMQRQVLNGAKILFVGTKRQAQQVVREAAEKVEMFYMSERWMGGTLTNIETIKKSIAKMRDIDSILADEENSNLKKKELVRLSRTGAKLHRDLDGIANMRRLPDVVVVIDVCHDENAIKEAQKLHIPIVAIVDTNGNPENIDYPIAANDDAVKSIKIIMDTLVTASADALELYKAKVADSRKEEKRKADEAKSADKDNKDSKPQGRRPARKAEGVNGDRKSAPRRKAPTAKTVNSLSELKKSDIAPQENA